MLTAFLAHFVGVKWFKARLGVVVMCNAGVIAL